ncbi:mediator-associated protein 2 [Arachis stenosperma]|uniref:mediator-associated protein 2 n=1 Tax=Arachis stenosperma TaxID=217475 RepID=UPI0025ACF996|nr:mediator-associated protein 2 [Arachis stenosperma]
MISGSSWSSEASCTAVAAVHQHLICVRLLPSCSHLVSTVSMVDSQNVEGYRPAPDFEEDRRSALLNLEMNDSTELWLIKLPFSTSSHQSRMEHMLSEIDGEELSFNLHSDGKLASFEDSSEKLYDFVSYPSQEPDEMVFVPSPTEPKIAGKISRRVSIVHYPDPKELEERKIIAKHAHQNSSGVTKTTSSRYFSTQISGRAGSSKGSRKSSVSQVSEPSNAAERTSGKKVSELSHGNSTGISGMSSDHSDGGKSKKRKHKE